jgi:hypothetical protein
VIAGAGGQKLRMWLAGEGQPDIDTINELARIFYWARRSGGQAHLERVTPELAELIELSGLADELAGSGPDLEP